MKKQAIIDLMKSEEMGQLGQLIKAQGAARGGDVKVYGQLRSQDAAKLETRLTAAGVTARSFGATAETMAKSYEWAITVGGILRIYRITIYAGAAYAPNRDVMVIAYNEDERQNLIAEICRKEEQLSQMSRHKYGRVPQMAAALVAEIAAMREELDRMD